MTTLRCGAWELTRRINGGIGITRFRNLSQMIRCRRARTRLFQNQAVPIGAIEITGGGGIIDRQGLTAQLACRLTADPDVDLTNLVNWSSSNPSIATVNQSGLVTCVGAGAVTITAEIYGSIDTSGITCYAYTGDVVLTPADQTVAPADPLAYVATLTHSNRGAEDVAADAFCTFLSDNEGIATIGDDGVGVAVADGACNISTDVALPGLDTSDSTGLIVATP